MNLQGGEESNIVDKMQQIAAELCTIVRALAVELLQKHGSVLVGG